ncbi:MAG: hypothetical protein B7C55_04690 [Actinomycetales bacterium mxb001]|nr:MAG: hypothetical protein B7C55_04690 [Actinomycetales bacterium mxb001]
MDTDGTLIDNVIVIGVIFIISIGLGWLAGRILDVKRGFLRSLVAGVVGFLGGFTLIVIQAYDSLDIEVFQQPVETLLLSFGWLGYALIVALITSLVMDAMLRPRRRDQGRRVPHPIRALRRRFAVWSRLWQIAKIARHNGLAGRRFASRSELFSPDGARAIRLTLEESGGMLVKFGQIASTREDLLPTSLTDELAQLRTAVPGLPPEVVRSIVEAELGRPIDEVFAEFSAEPLAAASIGVTHRAVLRDGRPVIVKVQRPGIEESVDRDGRVLVWAAGKLEGQSPAARRVGVTALAQELVAGINEELDFTREAANNRIMRLAHPDDEGVAYPEIFADLTTRRLIVMEEVQGRSVSDVSAVDRTGVEREILAGRLMDSFLQQVLANGVYHADPHPGNILIDEQGVLWFIDFGAVGLIDPVTLEGLQQMGLGFATRDPAMLARAVRRIAGREGEGIDIASLEFDIGVVLTDVQGGGFDPRAISEIIRVLNRHGVSAPPALTVLARAVLTMDGTLRTIANSFRMGPAAQRRMGQIVESTGGRPRDVLERELVRNLPVFRSLPQISEDIALQARAGRLSLRINRFDGPDGPRVERWIRYVLFTAVGVFGLISSALILMAAGLAGNETVANPLRIIGFTSLFLSAVMVMRVIAKILSARGPDE